MRVMAKTIAFAFLSITALWCFADTTTMLKPPGLRPVRDPYIVVPADYLYANRRLSLPHYRDSQGKPKDGWSQTYISTRRFNSNQSAWIYYRRQDLQRSVILDSGEDDREFCVWPGGTTIVIESYLGAAESRQDRHLIDIAVLSKADTNTAPDGKAFLAAEWSYGRFTSENKPSIDANQVQECHQCHAIALRLTGDLVFSRLP